MNKPGSNFHFALLLLLIALYFTVSALLIDDPRARLMPLVIGIPTVGVSFAQLFNERKARCNKEGQGQAENINWASAPQMLAWFAFFVLLIMFIGFNIGLPLYVLLYMKVREKENWLLSLGMSLLMVLIIEVGFEKILHVQLFEGWLWGILG